MHASRSRTVLGGLLIAFLLTMAPANATPNSDHTDGTELRSRQIDVTLGVGESDNMHVTNGELSVHAWWSRIAGMKPLADVKACFQRPGKNGGWANVKCTTKHNLREGGGSTSRRLNLRYPCSG